MAWRDKSVYDKVVFVVFGPMLGLVIVAVLMVFVCLGWFAIAPESTVYAKGFSEEAFTQVKVGMTVKEVEGLLGEPMGILATDGTKWTWIDGGRDPNWKERVFSSDAVVERAPNDVSQDVAQYYYSDCGSWGLRYQAREVYFGKDGRVLDTYAYLNDDATD
jgi:outer membrane protein assembly factor BamE (lipoprotein component of BamABCDE complex)